MPVTARLSRNFYDKFGEDAVNELVDWMNAVDLSYRTDLLQNNEANVARFNATLEARASELVALIERRTGELRAEMDRRFAAMDVRFQEVGTRLARFESRMLRWMLVFWTTTMIGVAATIVAVLQVRR